MKLVRQTVINGQRALAHSYAKINLTLDITGKRDDGYHTLETIMQNVNLSDIIIVDKQHEGIRVSTNKKFLPSNNKNIAYKAAELFFKESNINKGAKIHIHKNIPIAAGLAGGSGNAAATLAALNLLYDMPFSDEELLKIASKLGADVPYCLMGGTQMATGIGDIMEPLENKIKSYILLTTPPVAVSTVWAYNEFDKITEKTQVNTKEMLCALKNGDYHKMCDNLSNALEGVTTKEHPEIITIKEKMKTFGADGVLMSGSGPTVFGFFDDIKKAKAAQDSLSHKYKDVFLTTTI